MDQAAQSQTEHSAIAFSAGDPVQIEPAAYEIAQISLQQLEAIYGHVAPLMESVYERSSGELTEAALVSELASNRMQFWIVTDGERVAAVVGTSLDFVATGDKKATIRFCSGHHSEKWLHLLDEIEAWAAFEGCSAVRMIARKGWAKRVPDYKMTHVLLEKALP